MNPAYFSAIVGLSGAAIGGFTSIATSWLSQRTQMRQKALEIGRSRRERLYTAFIDEGSRLFADAIGHERDDVNDLVKLYSLVARMRLIASPPVMVAAEKTVQAVIDAYQAPNRSLHELRLFADRGGMDPLLEFSEACRQELIDCGVGL
jgi:hypothetical protein